jgi:hypothetical protein
MEQGFRMPENFDFDGANTAQRWTKWRKQFETYHVAAELKKKEADVQVAILLHAAGSEAQEIHSQFVFENEEDKKDTQKILDLFEAYCKPRKNVVFERRNKGQVHTTRYADICKTAGRNKGRTEGNVPRVFQLRAAKLFPQLRVPHHR